MLALSAVIVPPAFARGKDSEPAQQNESQARQSYRLALELYRAKRYEQAAAALRAAYDQSPRPAMLFNLGLTYAKLGDVPAAHTAIAAYLKALPDAPNRAQAERLLARLASGKAGLDEKAGDESEAPAQPADDDENPLTAKPRREAPRPSPQVNGGAPTAEGQAKGYGPSDRPARTPYRLWKWSMTGASLVLLGVGSYMLVNGAHQEDIVRAAAAPGSAPVATYDHRLEAYYENSRVNQTWGAVALGAGVAATAASITLFILDQRAQKAESAIRLHPVVGPGTAAILGEAAF